MQRGDTATPGGGGRECFIRMAGGGGNCCNPVTLGPIRLLVAPYLLWHTSDVSTVCEVLSYRTWNGNVFRQNGIWTGEKEGERERERERVREIAVPFVECGLWT